MSTLPRSERWAFFDCFAGLSGDMTLGALIDLGLPVEELQGLLPALGLAGVTLTARRVSKQHLTGVKVEIEAGAQQPDRTYREICALIQAALLAQDQTLFRLAATWPRVKRVLPPPPKPGEELDLEMESLPRGHLDAHRAAVRAFGIKKCQLKVRNR